MAPILSASIGVNPQILDDERLRSLRKSLEDLEMKNRSSSEIASSEDISVPLDIERLVALLEPYQSWNFEEQVSQ